MKSFAEIADIIKDVACPPFEFRFSCIQCNRTGQSRSVTSVPCLYQRHSWFVQAMLYRTDTYNGEEGWGHGSKLFISPHMDKGEIVKKCFVAARDYAEHEVRESFTWKGRRILGPHISIDSLWEVADTLEVRDPIDH